MALPQPLGPPRPPAGIRRRLSTFHVAALVAQVGTSRSSFRVRMDHERRRESQAILDLQYVMQAPEEEEEDIYLNGEPASASGSRVSFGVERIQPTGTAGIAWTRGVRRLHCAAMWETAVTTICSANEFLGVLRKRRAMQRLFFLRGPAILRKLKRNAQKRLGITTDVELPSAETLIEKVPYLRALGMSVVSRLARSGAFKARFFDEGEVVLRRGQVSFSLWYVVRGNCEISDDLAPPCQEVPVSERVIRPRSVFGSVLDVPIPSPVTIIATGSLTTLWYLSREKFEDFVKDLRDPSAEAQLNEILYQQTLESIPVLWPLTKSFFEKVPFFNMRRQQYDTPYWDPSLLPLDIMKPKVFLRGSVIFEKDTTPSEVLILCSGEVGAYRDGAKSATDLDATAWTETMRSEIEFGGKLVETFGETGVGPDGIDVEVPLPLYPLISERVFIVRERWKATYRARSKFVKCWSIPSDTFVAFLLSNPVAFLALRSDALAEQAATIKPLSLAQAAQVPLLEFLEAARFEKMRRRFRARCFEYNTNITTVGSSIENIYIVVGGEAKCISGPEIEPNPTQPPGVRTHRNPALWDAKVQTFHIGGAWEGLILGKWAHTWVALGVVETWEIPVTLIHEEFLVASREVQSAVLQKAQNVMCRLLEIPRESLASDPLLVAKHPPKKHPKKPKKPETPKKPMSPKSPKPEAERKSRPVPDPVALQGSLHADQLFFLLKKLPKSTSLLSLDSEEGRSSSAKGRDSRSSSNTPTRRATDKSDKAKREEFAVARAIVEQIQREQGLLAKSSSPKTKQHVSATQNLSPDEISLLFQGKNPLQCHLLVHSATAQTARHTSHLQKGGQAKCRPEWPKVPCAANRALLSSARTSPARSVSPRSARTIQQEKGAARKLAWRLTQTGRETPVSPRALVHSARGPRRPLALPGMVALRPSADSPSLDFLNDYFPAPPLSPRISGAISLLNRKFKRLGRSARPAAVSHQ